MSASRAVARKRRHVRVRRRVHGTAERPRLAVFRSNKYIYAQVIDDDAGRTIAAASSLEDGLKGKGVIFDRGGFPFHGRVKALADAAREAGLEF